MKSDKFKKILETRGFSLVELSIAIGIVMVSLVAAGNIVTLIYSSNSHLNSMSKQTIVKGNFIGQLMTESNWKSTYSDARNMDVTYGKMDCLYNHSDCSALVGAPATFRVVDSKLKVAYDPTATDGVTPNGFTPSGSTCTSFGSASDTCPYHYDLTWEPICTAGLTTCIDPLIKIHGKFHVNFASVEAGHSNSLDFMPMNFDLIMNMKPRTNLYAYPVTFYVNWNIDPGPYTPFNFSIPHGPIANAEGAITLDNVTVGIAGSLATKSGNAITYTPLKSYYGMDFIDYAFHDSIGNKGKGRAWMKVVTPFTWVGDGSDKKASSKENWCGNVTSDGICLHDLDPTAPFYDAAAGWIYPHFVFNSVCNVCSDIEIDIPHIDGLEMSPSFHGKITQTKDLLIESISTGWMSKDPFNKNYAHQGFFQGGGTFDTNGFNLLNQTDYVLAWGDQSKPPPAINFYLQAGSFLVSGGNTVSAFNSGLQIDSGVNFVNSGQIIIKKTWSALGYIATGPGINLGNLKIDTNGSKGPNHVGSNLNVKDLSLTSLNANGSGDVEGGVCGHVTDGSGDPNVYLNVSGTISSVGIGGEAYCGSSIGALIIKLVGVGPQPQEVQGSNDPLIPGVIPNLMTSATNTANFTGNLAFQGNTNLNGPTTFAAGSRVNFFYGALNAVTPPHFYDSGAVGGEWFSFNTPVYVDHDFTFDRCNNNFADGTNCHGYHLGTTDVVVNRIYLKGDLHMISGGMDLSSVEMVVVDFVNDTIDQSILGENLIGVVALPSIAVHKAGGKFSITQVAGAQGMNFMGSLDIVSAGSIPTFTVPKITLGNGQMGGYNMKFTSYLPLDFGTADLATISPGTYDLGNQVLKAGSLSLSYAFNGTAASMVMISGDVNTPTSQGGNATLEFVGGSANHHYTGVSTEIIAGWGVPWQKHNIIIDGSDKVILNAPVYDIGNISILGSGILDQNSQLIKNVDMIGPASSTWITGGPVPLNYTGGSSAAFLGGIQ